MIKLNSKRTPKPSGKKKKEAQTDEIIEVPEEENQTLDDDFGYYDDRGRARRQGNSYAKRHKRGENIPWIDTFHSSNIDAVAYDPKKKQMWVRFLGDDVYTYFDVPIQIYRGFWSAPSKGHYFWEKIRKNKRIKYQHLSSSIHLVPLKLSCAVKEQANFPSIAKSLKRHLTQLGYDFQDMKSMFNGVRLDFAEFAVEVAGYTNKVRVNIFLPKSDKVDFSVTKEFDTQKVVKFILDRIKKNLSSSVRRALNSELTHSDVLETDGLFMDLLDVVKEAFPNRSWTYKQTEDNVLIKSQDCEILIWKSSGDKWHVELSDYWSHAGIGFSESPDMLISRTISELMRLMLQGETEKQNMSI